MHQGVTPGGKDATVGRAWGRVVCAASLSSDRVDGGAGGWRWAGIGPFRGGELTVFECAGVLMRMRGTALVCADRCASAIRARAGTTRFIPGERAETDSARRVSKWTPEMAERRDVRAVPCDVTTCVAWKALGWMWKPTPPRDKANVVGGTTAPVV